MRGDIDNRRRFIATGDQDFFFVANTHVCDFSNSITGAASSDTVRRQEGRILWVHDGNNIYLTAPHSPHDSPLYISLS